MLLVGTRKIAPSVLLLHGVGSLQRVERLDILTKTYMIVTLIVKLDTSKHVLRTVPPMTLPNRHTINPSQHKLH